MAALQSQKDRSTKWFMETVEKFPCYLAANMQNGIGSQNWSDEPVAKL